MFNIYLNRDNKVSLRLVLNDATIGDDIVTKAQLLIPGDHTVSGNDILIDSSVDSEISLASNATVVNIDIGGLSLKTGLANCYLTIYDASNTDGIAWAQVPIRVLTWKP